VMYQQEWHSTTVHTFSNEFLFILLFSPNPLIQSCFFESGSPGIIIVTDSGKKNATLNYKLTTESKKCFMHYIKLHL
jgi:hypothetical protein